MFLSFQPQFVVESQQKMFSFDIIVMLLCLFRHDGAECLGTEQIERSHVENKLIKLHLHYIHCLSHRQQFIEF